jgi:hypothetical protein
MSSNRPIPPRGPWGLMDWVRAPLLLIALPTGTAIAVHAEFGGSVLAWVLGFAAGLGIGGGMFSMYRDRSRWRR